VGKFACFKLSDVWEVRDHMNNHNLSIQSALSLGMFWFSKFMKESNIYFRYVIKAYFCRNTRDLIWKSILSSQNHFSPFIPERFSGISPVARNIFLQRGFSLINLLKFTKFCNHYNFIFCWKLINILYSKLIKSI